MNQFLLILRGMPASGKSTLSKKFRNFEKKVIWLKTDNFKEFFADDTSLFLDEVYNCSLILLKNYLSRGFSVVMDGVFRDVTVIDRTIIIAKEANVRTVIYELNCSLSNLIKRDSNRPGVKEGVRKPLESETMNRIYEILHNKPHPQASPLDTEHLSIDEAIAIIKNGLNNV